MNKFLIILMVVCMLVFVSCSDKQGAYNKNVSLSDTITYSMNRAENTNRLSKFIENVEKNNIDRINIINHTVEGDPITTQLYFNGKDIEIAVDISKDKFGGQDKDKILYDKIMGGNKLKEDLNKYLIAHHFTLQN